MTKTDTATETKLSVADLLKVIADDPLLNVRRSAARCACKFCGCFLALNREEPTGFHTKLPNGTIQFVIVYYGKSYCRYCHKFQV